MDGAPLISVQIAQDKAYTAVGLRHPEPRRGTTSSRTTRPWPPARPTGIDRLVDLRRRLPDHRRRRLVGGIGVSGGHYSEDAAVAEAALATLG